MTTKEFKKLVNFMPHGPERKNYNLLGSLWDCCGVCSYMVVCNKPTITSKSMEEVEAKCSANQGKLFRVSPVSICDRFKSVEAIENDS